MNGQGHTVAITARKYSFTALKSSLCLPVVTSVFPHYILAVPFQERPIARVMQQAAFRVVQTIPQRISSSTEEKAATNTLKKKIKQIKYRH